MKLVPPVVEITEEKALDAIRHLMAAMEQGNSLSPHLKIAVAGLSSYLRVLELLSRRGMGIQQLRRSLGVMSLDPEEGTEGQTTKKPRGKTDKKPRHNHGRRGSKAFPKAEQRYFAHPDFDEPGSPCPDCGKGHLYPHLGRWHRFHG